MNITDANRWLPLAGDEKTIGTGLYTEQRILLQMKFTPPAIFDELNENFWWDHFSDLSYADLLDNYKQLGLAPNKNGEYMLPKSLVLRRLVTYFQEAVS